MYDEERMPRQSTWDDDWRGHGMSGVREERDLFARATTYLEGEEDELRPNLLEMRCAFKRGDFTAYGILRDYVAGLVAERATPEYRAKRAEIERRAAMRIQNDRFYAGLSPDVATVYRAIYG